MRLFTKSKRQKHNYLLLDTLKVVVSQYPDMRFGQILEAIHMVNTIKLPDGTLAWENEFYTEPDMLLKRVKEQMERLERRG